MTHAQTIYGAVLLGLCFLGGVLAGWPFAWRRGWDACEDELEAERAARQVRQWRPPAVHHERRALPAPRLAVVAAFDTTGWRPDETSWDLPPVMDVEAEVRAMIARTFTPELIELCERQP
jgi:hypothetical protein